MCYDYWRNYAVVVVVGCDDCVVVVVVGCGIVVVAVRYYLHWQSIADCVALVGSTLLLHHHP